eukprot:TRINITY_DN9747_c0_g1_i3.p1 TRINITY_DN9747_c0_g1~~TRINITY_DN9747_c0_g1_i3.p1  ORF type:complete len:441 (+),score=129.64 TRINITY_DN9747_c0_g1_i3:184-1506(+)
MPQVILRIYLMDESHKTVYIDPEETTIEQLWILMSQKLLLDAPSAECFFIWAVSPELELLLYADQTVQDIYDDWEALTASIKAEKSTLATALSSSRPGVLQRTLTKTKVLSAFKSASSGLQTSASSIAGVSGKSSGSSDRTLERSKTLAVLSRTPSMPVVAGKSGEKVHGVSDAEEFRFVFRPTAVLPVELEQALVKAEAIRLLYIQAVHHVIHSNYPTEVALAVRLAGVQIQEAYGDQRAEHRGFVAEALSRFVPEHLIKERKAEEWTAALCQEHSFHTGKDVGTLQRQYLDIVQQCPYYGSTFFRVKHIPALQSFYKTEFEGTVHLGINHCGIHLIEPKAMKIVSWDFNDFVYWDSTPGNFVFEVKTGIKDEPVRAYNFKTPQAHFINDLMHDWSHEWEKKVKERRRDGHKGPSEGGDRDKMRKMEEKKAKDEKKGRR